MFYQLAITSLAISFLAYHHPYNENGTFIRFYTFAMVAQLSIFFITLFSLISSLGANSGFIDFQAFSALSITAFSLTITCAALVVFWNPVFQLKSTTFNQVFVICFQRICHILQLSFLRFRKKSKNNGPSRVSLRNQESENGVTAQNQENEEGPNRAAIKNQRNI